MESLCLKCGSSESVKSGHARGASVTSARNAGTNYTRISPKGRPFKEKVLAVVLFLSGLSMNAAATISWSFGQDGLYVDSLQSG